jgi:hypothetical protein
VFFGKESEKPSEEKPVEKSSGEKPSKQPQPKLNLSSCGFIVTIVGEMVTRVSFSSRGSVRREWQRSGLTRYHPSNGVIEPRVQMPRAKASVSTVLAWGERKAAGGAAGRATPVRLVQVWTDNSLGFVLLQMLGSVLEVVVLVVGLESLQVVTSLGVLPLVLNTGMRGVVALRWRGGTVHGLPFVVFVLLWLERVDSLVVVTMVVFVEVALVGEMF